VEKPKKITAAIRDLVSAYTALQVLTEKRGLPDSVTSLNVGMTMRSLREVQEDSGEAHKFLMDSHAKRDDDGSVVRGADPSTVQLEDPQAFLEESRDILQKEREVKIWPIPVSKLLVSRKSTTCPRCKQLTGMPDPESYATLVDLGILYEVVEERVKKEEDKEETDGDANKKDD